MSTYTPEQIRARIEKAVATVRALVDCASPTAAAMEDVDFALSLAERVASAPSRTIGYEYQRPSFVSTIYDVPAELTGKTVALVVL